MPGVVFLNDFYITLQIDSVHEPMRVLDEVLVRSALGSFPENYNTITL